jgi:hypothetical protein
MSVTGNTLFPVPESDSADLCKRFALAFSNAAMYGMDHAVTAVSQAAAFDGLVSILDLYGEIEWCLCDDGLLLNGKPMVTSKGPAQALVDQMRRANVTNLVFCPPPDRREFGMLMSILSAEPGSARIADGVDAALAQAGFRTIRMDKAVYERVGSKGAAVGTERPSSAVPDTKRSSSSGKPSKGCGKGRVYDLDSELFEQDAAEMTEFLQATMPEPGIPDATMPGMADVPLKSLLQSVNQLASARGVDGQDSQGMTHVLQAIGREVDVLIRRTKGQASTLAQRVDADRDAVAALEQEARDRGVGLQLSREELLKSLAEINQELVQPLTVSSALLQMLKAGTAGTLSDAQRELVQTASEGMDRLERLIAYLQRISGFPVDISPDAGLLSEINSGR